MASIAGKKVVSAEEFLAAPAAKKDMGPTMEVTVPGTDEELRSKESKQKRPYLYLALQCNAPLAPSLRYSLGKLAVVKIGRGDQRTALFSPRHKSLRLEMADSWVSADHARLQDQVGRWVLDDLRSKNGTYVNGTRVKRAVLADGDVLEIGHSFLIFRVHQGGAGNDPDELSSEQLSVKAPGLCTLVPSLGRQFDALAQMAKSDVCVVIRGESGTGKELMARATHALSERTGPFIAVNCGAIPSDLIASELFGHVKGAFSGAVHSRPGLVRSADRGTLFLDEIGDLALPLQNSFLRVLQERQVVPVGDTKPVDVNIRLCAATHRDLELMVAQKKLREDLYGRISGFTLRLPPLRERREDLGLLISSVLRKVVSDRAEEITLHRKAARALALYRWPLNIRELEKCLEAAAVLAKDGMILVEHLPDPVRATLEPGYKSRASGTRDPNAPLSIREVRERDKLVKLLREHSGNLSAVAHALKKDRIQVRRWLKRYEVNVNEYRSHDSKGQT